MDRPRAPARAAVLTLIARSNLLGSSMGRPAGRAPFAMRFDVAARAAIDLREIGTISSRANLIQDTLKSCDAGKLARNASWASLWRSANRNEPTRPRMRRRVAASMRRPRRQFFRVSNPDRLLHGHAKQTRRIAQGLLPVAPMTARSKSHSTPHAYNVRRHDLRSSSCFLKRSGSAYVRRSHCHRGGE
jgi:hypothetical protein